MAHPWDDDIYGTAYGGGYSSYYSYYSGNHHPHSKAIDAAYADFNWYRYKKDAINALTKIYNEHVGGERLVELTINTYK